MHNQKCQSQDGKETVCAIRLGSAFNRNFPSFCFKPLQAKGFEYVLKGKDIVVALLTGFGKSLLFQLLPDFLPVKVDNTLNANMADYWVGTRNKLHESEASETSVFCFDNLPLKNLASWTV